MPYLSLHIVLAVFFAVHALRRGQDLYWVVILFMFPYIGSAVYFFACYLPELRLSRGAFLAKRSVGDLFGSARELRQARAAFDMAPSVGNRSRLAAALLAADQAPEALEHYRVCLNGPFANDPACLLGLAQASLETGDAAVAADALERLFAAEPARARLPEPSLLYARAVAALNRSDARDAFEAALRVGSGPEVKVRFAQWLEANGDAADRQRAGALYQEIVAASRHWHRHARHLNGEWLRLARKGVAG